MWTKSAGQRRVDSTSPDSRRRRVCFRRVPHSPPTCSPSRPPGTATYCSMLWTLLRSPANSNWYGIRVPGRTRRRPCRSPALPPPQPAGPRQAAPARELGVSTSPAGSTSPSQTDVCTIVRNPAMKNRWRVVYVFATLAGRKPRTTIVIHVRRWQHNANAPVCVKRALARASCSSARPRSSSRSGRARPG